MTFKQIVHVTVIVLSSVQLSMACDCIDAGSVKTAVKQSAIVVKAKVISVETWYSNGDSGLYINKKLSDKNFEVQLRYKFVVLEKYKGNTILDTITIITPAFETACGYIFKKGKKYLVYAYSKAVIGEIKKRAIRNEAPNIYETNICTRTKPVNSKEIGEIREAMR